MHMRRAFAALIACVLLASTAACGGSGKDASSDKGTTIHIGLLSFAGFAPIWLAKDKGYFKDEGLNVVLDKITDPSNGVANIVSGRMQFSLLTPEALAVALTKNVPLKVATPLYFANGEQGIYVKNDSSIKTVADLAGKKIALGGLANNSQAGTEMAMKSAGVDPNSAKYVLVPISDTGATLLSGKVDAAQLTEPAITVNTGKVRPIIPDLLSPFGDEAVASVMVTSSQYAKEHPDAVAAFQRAMAKAETLAGSDEAAVRDVVGKYTETPADLLPKIILSGFKPTLAVKSQEEQARAMVDLGFIPTMPDIAGAQISSPAFTEN